MAARSSAKPENGGKTVAKQVGGGSDNPAINFDNPPDAPKRKIKMPSRKF
jgi:hypothetical protein